MENESRDKLRNAVKQKLKITWNQTETEDEIITLLEDAESYLNHLLGAEINYSDPGIERLLFLSFCMYAWNDCQEEFEDAYLKEINRCKAKYEVKHYEEKKDETK